MSTRGHDSLDTISSRAERRNSTAIASYSAVPKCPSWLLELRPQSSVAREQLDEADKMMKSKGWSSDAWVFDEASTSLLLDVNCIGRELQWTAGLIDQASVEMSLDLAIGTSSENCDSVSCTPLFSIGFHTATGVVVLTSHTDVSMKHLVNGKWVSFSKCESRALFQKNENMFSMGRNAIYSLSFRMEQWTQRDLEGLRHKLFEKKNLSLVKMLQTFPPMADPVSIGDFIVRERVYKAGPDLSIMNPGFCLWEGIPVGIKECITQNELEREAIINELRIGAGLRNVGGVSALLGTTCIHGELECEAIQDKVYMIYDYGIGTFEMDDWRGDRYILHASLQDFVLGLQSLHKRGIYHRSICLENMLLVTIEPVKASLFLDMNTAFNNEELQGENQGPMHTRAPETFEGEFTTASDLWALAYAGAQLLGYRPSFLDRITIKRYGELRGDLLLLGDRNKNDAPLTKLLLSILQWEPGKRPSVTEVLGHECWRRFELPQRATDDTVDHWWRQRDSNYDPHNLPSKEAKKPRMRPRTSTIHPKSSTSSQWTQQELEWVELAQKARKRQSQKEDEGRGR